MARAGRRTFLGKSGMLLLIGFARRVFAQRAQALRFHRLARPVSVPLADLSMPQRVRPFIAEATTLSTAANPNQSIRISGMIIRTDSGADQPDRFSAVCTRCPHEHCDVDFISDPNRLAAEVIAEMARKANEPVYLCRCHNSTFDVTNGDRLSGPAPRGLYRFRVTTVSANTVEIGEVEEDVLVFI